MRENSVDPDQTAPKGAVWSGSVLFFLNLQALKIYTIHWKY